MWQAYVGTYPQAANPAGGRAFHAGVLARTLEPAMLAEGVARVAANKHRGAELRERQVARAAELEGFPQEQAQISALWEAAGHD